MSRFSDYDDYEGEPEQILAMGRWQRNARAALKGKRGRKALAELREALMALPEHRLIDSALCTVGGAEQRAPALSDAELAARRERLLTQDAPAEYVERWASSLRVERDEERRRLAQHIERQGEGVCAIGAYIWHKKVQAGADPAEVFETLPTVHDSEDGDALGWTARLGEEAGLTFTLAWELAYRNDEKFRNRTPEERWTAFVAWIDQELAASAA